MDITILCTEPNHPVVKRLRSWVEEMTLIGHSVILVFAMVDLQGGDLLFLVSCSQLIREDDRKKYKATLVLHASDLPKGRGWSPYIWEILYGSNQLTVSLFEANETVDSGVIWLKRKFTLEGHELLPEINEKLFDAELYLMSQAVEQFEIIKPFSQFGEPGPFLSKRSPEDSRLDPDKSIAEQFDLLRVVDSDRYPAFFDFRGKRYVIKIEKINK